MLTTKITLIKLGEPKWLSGGSHTSVFNGGPLESHFGSPEIQKHVYMYLAPLGTIFIHIILVSACIRSVELLWLQLGAILGPLGY